MKLYFYTVISIIILALASCMGHNKGKDLTVVTTTEGKVKGYMKDSVLIFKGIPYASSERFMPAVPHAKWDTVMDCTRYGNISPQGEQRKYTAYNPLDTVMTMGEDCLNLNIWTSARTSDDFADRPVMVWLHGGGFDYGYSHVNLAADGSKLAKGENVVVVSLNHRLNALGHLDLSAYGEEYEGSGNLALTDIVQALKWIKSNIKAFGGNPDNVTIFGHGAGGVKVLALMGMPMAKGYFHKAIIQSGTLTGTAQTQEVSRLIGQYTMEEAGATTVDELKALPYDSLLSASTRAVLRARAQFHTDEDNLVKLGPVIDHKILPGNLFSDTCVQVSKDVPVIIGSTFSEDNTQQYVHDLENNAKNIVHKLTPEELDKAIYERFGENTEAVKKAFAEAYPDKQLQELLTMDTHVRSIVLNMAHKFARRGNAPVYVYLFNWVSPLDNGLAKSFRASELPFIFNNYDLAEFSRAGGDEARRLARIMSRCWATFARTGNPNNSITPFWRRISPGEGRTALFGRDIQIVGYPDLPLMQLAEPKYTSDIVLYDSKS
ncbi:MAG: carboxylesterase family protein [Muribaculaceae bacterium]|nr:carboxylesterase family protein [Muribaculaceae bacterium]